MTTKQAFSAEEWEAVVKTPLMAGMVVILSDLGAVSMVKESKAMMDAITKNPAPDEASELVAAYRADVMERAANHEKLPGTEKPKGEPQQILKDMMAAVSAGAALVDSKADAAEAAGFKDWTMSVAQSTAEAAKEGGVLGIGAVRVSDKETAALDDLRVALGIANS